MVDNSPCEKIKQPKSLDYRIIIGACVLLLVSSALLVRIINHFEYWSAIKEIVIIEGEKPKESNFFLSEDTQIETNKNFLSEEALELYASSAEKEEYYVAYDFEVSKDGAYDIFLAGAPPGPNEGDTGDEWFCPYSASIDGVLVNNYTEKSLEETWPSYVDYEYYNYAYYFIKLMSVQLSKGRHEIKITVTGRRKYDNSFTFFIDALIISPKSFKPKSSIGKIPKGIFY